MHRRNRLAHALHKTVVVRKRAVHLGKRSSRQHHIGKGSSVGFKQFLNNQKIELAECVLAASQVLGKETSGHVERANACCRPRRAFASALIAPFIEPHVVRADAVVEERQRMKQNATALSPQARRAIEPGLPAQRGLSSLPNMITRSPWVSVIDCRSV